MRWLLWWRPPCLLRSVIVNLKHPETEAVAGVLWASRGPWLTLREATALKQPDPQRSEVLRSPIEGEAIVHRSNVAYLQVMP